MSSVVSVRRSKLTFLHGATSLSTSASRGVHPRWTLVQIRVWVLSTSIVSGSATKVSDFVSCLPWCSAHRPFLDRNSCLSNFSLQNAFSESPSKWVPHRDVFLMERQDLQFCPSFFVGAFDTMATDRRLPGHSFLASRCALRQTHWMASGYRVVLFLLPSPVARALAACHLDSCVLAVQRIRLGSLRHPPQ